MADNVIQVIIKSQENLSVDVRRIEAELRKLQGTTEGVSGRFGNAMRSSSGLQRNLAPLRSVLIQLTGVTGSFGTALFNLVRFGFSPIGLAITGIIAAVSGLVSAWSNARKSTEEFNKALDTQHQQLFAVNLDYRLLTKSITEAEAAVLKFNRAQAAGLQERIDDIEKWKSIIGALLGQGPVGALMEKLGFGEEEMRGLFGLSKKDLETMEARLSALKGLSEATGRGVKRNIELEKAIALKQKDMELDEKTISILRAIADLEEKRAKVQGRPSEDIAVRRDAIAAEEALIRKREKFEIEFGKLPKGIVQEQARRDLQLLYLKGELLHIDYVLRINSLEAEHNELLEEGNQKIRNIIETRSEEAKLLNDAIVTALEAELDLLKLQEAPYAKIIEKTRELEQARRDAVDSLIKEKEIQRIGLIVAQRVEGDANQAQIDAIESQIQALQAQKAALHDVLSTQAEIHKQAEDMADTLAGDFVDRFISLMEDRKMDLSTFLRDLGRTIVSQFLQGMLAANLIGPLEEMFNAPGMGGRERRQTMRGGTAGVLLGGTKSLLSLFGLFGGGFPSLGPFGFSGGEVPFNWNFGKGGYLGGNFVPVAALRKFQKGGVANRPTIGVIGEEGDEIVARMKPARPQDSETRGVSVIIQGDIVPRERNMRREDVIMIVADDMERGGKTATAGIKLGNRR